MDFREYENRVADVLAFLAGGTATVQRDQRLWGHLTEGYRQVDVLVCGRVGEQQDATMVVDCKHWNKPVNIIHVGSFIDLAKDVGADVGLMMTSCGGSARAKKRAKNESGRGIRVDVLSVEQLAKWSPPGTVATTCRFPRAYRDKAERQLRRAGFRVEESKAWPPTEIEVVLQISRHYGMSRPDGGIQASQWDGARAALRNAGVEDPVHVSNGIQVGGGDPRKPWLQMTIDGHPTDMRFEATDEAEAEAQLDVVAPIFMNSFALDRTRISYVRPDNWPVQEWPLRGFIGAPPESPGVA
jgi:Restriction endonuclease